MNKNKLKIFALSIVLVMLFTLIPTNFCLAKTSDERKSNSLKATNFKEFEPQIIKLKRNNFLSLGLSSSNDNDDVLVSNGTGNESQPSIAVSGSDVIVAYEYENEYNLSINIKKSSDFGYTWDNQITSFENATSPSFLKLKYGRDFFASFLSTENTSYIYEFLDSGNALEWDYSNITNSTGDHIGRFFDFETPNVIPYQDSIVNWFIGTIGDADFIGEYNEYDCTDCPIFICKDKDSESPDASRTIIFFPEVTGCNNISLSLGENEEEDTTIYGTCEINNGIKNEILFFQGNHDLWTDQSTSDLPLITQTLNLSEDVFHPQITVKENHIYIVVETESNEIKIFHSSEYGEEGSWDVYTVTDEGTPVSPLIYIDSSKLICTFVDSNNLYMKESENHGMIWSDAEKVNSNNDSVISGYRNVDIGDSDRIIWADNRGINNTDIYMYLSYRPSVDLNIINVSVTNDMPFLPTNNYISVTVRNDGNVPTTKDIPINISYEREDGDKTLIKYPFVISDRLSPGETVTRKRPMFRFSFPEYFMSFADFAGITNITAHIDPKNTADDSDLENNVKTINVQYEDIFPRVGKNENLEIIFEIISLIFKLIFS